MTAGEIAIVAGSFAGLIAAGWLFLDQSLYKGHEDKDRVVQARPPPTQSMPAVHRGLVPGSVQHSPIQAFCRYPDHWPFAIRGRHSKICKARLIV